MVKDNFSPIYILLEKILPSYIYAGNSVMDVQRKPEKTLRHLKGRLREYCRHKTMIEPHALLFLVLAGLAGLELVRTAKRIEEL